MKKILFVFALLPFVAFGQKIKKHDGKSNTTVNIPTVEETMGWDMVQNTPEQNGIFLQDADVNTLRWQTKVATQKKWNYKRTLLGCGVAFVGGVANGYHETILNHYSQFKRVHPNANDKFWNPEISWLNKYENYDLYGKKEAFLGSTTFLAWTTDAYHLSSVISNTSLIGATCIITIGEKHKWYEYGIDILAMSLSRSLGFHLIYSTIYK